MIGVVKTKSEVKDKARNMHTKAWSLTSYYAKCVSMQFLTIIMFTTGQMLWLRFMSEYMDKTLYKIADYTLDWLILAYRALQ